MKSVKQKGKTHTRAHLQDSSSVFFQAASLPF